MIRTLLVIGCTAVTLFSFAHGVPTIDSLKQVLTQHVSHDSLRVEALLALANAIVPNNPPQAKSYADEAVEISQKIDWKSGIAKGLRMQGYASYIMADFLNAVEYFQKAIVAAQSLDDKKLQGTILNNMALVYNELGEYDKALANYKTFLDIARDLRLSREESIALMNTGLVYFKQGKQSDALKFYEQSLAIAETNNHQQVIAYVLSNMGAAYDKSGEYEKALVAFKKSIAVAEKIGDARIMVQSLGGVGEASFWLKDYSTAEEYSLRALKMAKEIPLLEYEKEMHQGLSEIYAKQGKTEEAFEAYKTFVLLRDSIASDEKKQEFKRKEMQFEFEKKAAVLNAEHQAELSRQALVKNAAIGGGAVLLLATLFSFLFYKKRRDADEKRKEAEFQTQVADTEMKALRAQMNPHFIFNSLNSISAYIGKHDTASADFYLTKFAKLMRLVLENSEQKEVRLADDLRALELYMQLEAMRFAEAFKYEIKVDETIDREATLVPPLLLQPFVENSIWYGIAQKRGEGKIAIRIQKEDEMINCIVEDNGVGREKAAAMKSEGNVAERRSLGMKITKARIDILNKIKQSKASVELSDLAEGTRVEVRLPLALQF